jgi:hypothetical protein
MGRHGASSLLGSKVYQTFAVRLRNGCYATKQDVKTPLPSRLTARQGNRRRCEVGLPGMALSAIAAAAGAIMYWAVTYQGAGFRLSTVGIILMIAGAFGFVVSAIVFAVSRGPGRTNRHSMDRQDVDARGNTSSVTKTQSSDVQQMRKLSLTLRSALTSPLNEPLVNKSRFTLERSTRNVCRRRNRNFDSRHHSHRFSREAMNTQ